MAGVLKVTRSRAAIVAILTSLSVLAGLTTEASAKGVKPGLSAAGEKKRPGTQKTKTVKVREAKGKPYEPKGKADPPDKRPKAVWPTDQEGTANLAPLAAEQPAWLRVGGLPVWLNRPSPRPDKKKSGANAPAEQVPGEITVRMLDRKQSENAHVNGALLQVAAPASGRVKVGVNYSQFASAHSQDWASRLRLVQLPDCALTTPDLPECQTVTELQGVNNPATSTVVADVEVPAASVAESGEAGTAEEQQPVTSAAPALLAVMAAQAGPGGDWTASKLASSADWVAGGNTGGFSWNYSVQVPPVPGELVPEITLSYDSGASDGKSSPENQQASWIGEGFDYSPGFIERSYRSCRDEGAAANDSDAGDLCWWNDNARLSINGKAGELIRDPDQGIWRLKDDDGTVLRRYTGDPDGTDEANDDNGDNNREWWVMSTPDGMRYFFGRNRVDDWTATSGTDTDSTWTVPVRGDDAGDPCYNTVVADSYCQQAWRWNLDHVIDSRDNTITYYYEKEQNHYSKNSQTTGGTAYTSGGYLSEIHYGQRRGSTHTKSPAAMVTFERAARTDWPEDQRCVADENCGLDKRSPSFFERQRLSNIVAFIQEEGSNSQHNAVQSWDLTHDYRNGVLWLEKLQHRGINGQNVLNSRPISFDSTSLANRVTDSPNGTLGLGADDRPASARPRMLAIDNGSGGLTSVIWSPTNCVYDRSEPGVFALDNGVKGAKLAPATNTKRCFPAKFLPASAVINNYEDKRSKTENDWFHKYVVDRVVESSSGVVGTENKVTDYSYLGGGAWRFEARDGLNDYLRTFNQWRGYAVVRTAVGGELNEGKIYTETRYARGMAGNPDRDPIKVAGAQYPAVYLHDNRQYFGTEGILDHDRLAGQAYETQSFSDYYATEETGSVTRPRFYEVDTANHLWGGPEIKIGYVRPDWVINRSYDHSNNELRTRVDYTYDDAGRTILVEDQGSVSNPNDDTCTQTTYPSGTWSDEAGPLQIPSVDWQDLAPWFLDLYLSPGRGLVDYYSSPVRMLTVNKKCTAFGTPGPNLQIDGNLEPGQVVSDVKTIYDGTAYGDYPTRGNATSMATFTGVVNGTSQTAVTTTSAFDKFGRTTRVTQHGATEADDRVTRMSFKQNLDALGEDGWLKSSTITNPLGHEITNVYNPANGMPVKVTDANGRVAEAEYDPLGRIVKAWLPDNPRASNLGTPSTVYSYDTWSTTNDPVQVVTRVLTDKNAGTYDTKVEIFDGLLRPRQTQTEAVGGGKMITDVFYDSRGLPTKTNAPYRVNGSLNGGATSYIPLVESADNDMPSQTVKRFDHMGRETRSTLYSYGTAKQVTQTVYQGNRTTVVPPSGGFPSMLITNARGQVTETRQYKVRDDWQSRADDATAYVASKYFYDTRGRQDRIWDAAENEWMTGFDEQGRVSWTKDPDKGRSEFTYDAFDQVASTKDARGKVITYVYDKLGRNTESWSGGTRLTEFIYDTLPNAEGMPVSQTRFTDGKAYTVKVRGYDTMYRPTGSIVTIPASEGFGTSTTGTTSFATSQTYNFDGTPRTTTYPAVGGATGLPLENVTTYYNGDGLPTWNTGLSTYVADTLYNSYGEVTQLSMAAVSDRFVWQTFTRDEATHRLTSVSVKRQTSSVWEDSKTSYAYTPYGSITSAVTETPSAIDRECYTHDYAQRLKEAWTTNQADCSAAPATDKIGGPAPYWNAYTYDEATGLRETETLHAVPGSAVSSDIVRTYNYGAPLGSGGLESPHALQSVSESSGGTTTNLGYTYDQTGNTISRPDGQTMAWDDEGKLTSVSGDGFQTGTYRLANRTSRKCLDVDSASLENGANLAQYACNQTAAQDFKAVPVTPGSEHYTLVNPNSGKCLAVAGSSQADGANVVQWECLGIADQQWKLERHGDHYRLKNKNSGKCLDVANNATAAAANAVQQPCWNTDRSQQWKLRSAASYVYDASGNRLISKDASGATLSLPGQEVKIKYTNAGQTTSVKSAVRYYSHAGQTVAYRTGTASTNLYFLVPDYQGSSDITVNAVDQTQYSQRWFEPFGAERVPNTDTGIWPLQADKGFVGGTKDPTGLTHLGAREYDTETGRFTSADPVFVSSDANSWTSYGYANSSPVNASDPSGMCIDWPYCKHPDAPSDSDAPAGVDGGPAGSTATNPAPPTSTPSPASPPVEKKCGTWDFKCKSAKVWNDHKATIVSTAVGLGCGAVVGWTGVGAVGCGALAGTVYYAMSTPQDQWSATGVLKAAAVGAGTAVLGGIAAKALGTGLKTVANKVTSKLASRPGPAAKKIADKAAGGPKSAASQADDAASCSTNSFVPGTRVLMADGTTKPIEDIKLGDPVVATDEKTGISSSRLVQATITGTGHKDLVEIKVDVDGSEGSKTDLITATNGHPFWIPSLKEWVNAGELKPGMWLRTSAGTHVQITALQAWSAHRTVHNLTVTTDHTYYVLAGNTPILVHNTGQLCDVTARLNERREKIKASANRRERPGTIAEMRTSSGLIIPGRSGFQDEMNPLLQKVLDSVDHTNTCSEIHCLNTAMNASIDWEGSSFTVMAILSKRFNTKWDGVLLQPCSMCQRALGSLGLG